MWYIHKLECCIKNFSSKKKDTIKYAGKWMDLENTILSEATQT